MGRRLEGLVGDKLAAVGICAELIGPAPGGPSVLSYLGGVPPWGLLRDWPRQASPLGAMPPPSQLKAPALQQLGLGWPFCSHLLPFLQADGDCWLFIKLAINT